MNNLNQIIPNEAKWLDEISYHMLSLLAENGDTSVSEIVASIEEKKEIWELIPTEKKTGYYEAQPYKKKWEVDFFSRSSSEFVKAKFLEKDDGMWSLSEKGMEAVNKSDNYEDFKKLVKEAKTEQKITDQHPLPIKETGDGKSEGTIATAGQDKPLSEEEDDARQDIEKYIRHMHWEKFQDLCAALLQGMGYYVRDVSPPGADGGVDVWAYTDPIGAKQPRIKLQAKHSKDPKGNKADEIVIDNLQKIINEGDIGIIATTSPVKKNLRNILRNHPKHIDIIDLPRLVNLWREHYDKIPEEGKMLLPLRPIYFLDKDKAPKLTNEKS